MEILEFNRPDGKDLQLEIIPLEKSGEKRNKNSERHRHNFHSLLFVQSGSSKQEVDFEEYVLSGGQILFIPIGAIHCESPVQSLNGFAVLFTNDFFSVVQKELLNGFLQYAIAKRKLLFDIPEEQRATYKLYFDLLIQEQESAPSQNQIFILQNLMLALLNKMETAIQQIDLDNSFIVQRNTFQKFINLLDQHYLTEKSVLFYTQSLNLTQKNLNSILKEMLGRTAQDLIIDKILLEAKRELCFSQKSVKEIATQLGYDNQYYFSRIFKKRLTLSPLEFRKRFAQ